MIKRKSMAERTIDGRVYPIGIQSFQKIIEEGYTYVDKTYFISKLVRESNYVFLSRPRRFGKNLLLSSIHAYFEGRRELFKGLAIDSLDMDWTPRPVLHFDFNSEDYSAEEALAKLLSRQLEEYEKEFGMADVSDTEAIPERHSYKGRSDLEVLTPDYVYLFEFKYNMSLQDAMQQIYSRDYAGRYAKDSRTVWLIGANFVEKKDERRLEYRVEKLLPQTNDEP